MIEPVTRPICTADGHEFIAGFFRPRSEATLWEPYLLPALASPGPERSAS